MTDEELETIRQRCEAAELPEDLSLKAGPRYWRCKTPQFEIKAERLTPELRLLLGGYLGAPKLLAEVDRLRGALLDAYDTEGDSPSEQLQTARRIIRDALAGQS